MDEKLTERLAPIGRPDAEWRASRRKQLNEAIRHALNCHCAENGSNTPDFILAGYLMACLDAYDMAVIERGHWYGRHDSPGA